MKQLPSGRRWDRGQGGHTSPHRTGQTLFVAVACCKGLWETWRAAGRPGAQLSLLLLGGGVGRKAGAGSGLGAQGQQASGVAIHICGVRVTVPRAAREGEWGAARPQDTGTTSLFSMPGLGAGAGVRAPGGGVKTGHGASRTCRKLGSLGLCRPRPGVDQAAGLRRCPPSEVWPSSCGHCPTCDADSACPVVTAPPSALAPDPLAGRTLDTFCFERKQTLLKLLPGAKKKASRPLPWDRRTPELRGNLTGRPHVG